MSETTQNEIRDLIAEARFNITYGTVLKDNELATYNTVLKELQRLSDQCERMHERMSRP